MIYTFSQANYSSTQFSQYLKTAAKNDAILLWQDGVLLGLIQTQHFHLTQAPCYALLNDVEARGLTQQLTEKLPELKLITFAELVRLTEQHYPQLAL